MIKCPGKFRFVEMQFSIAFIAMLSLTGCKSVNPEAFAEPTYHNLQGTYTRNIAQGWTRPDKNTEIIPDIPKFQVIQLKGFRRFSYMDLNDSLVHKGKWKLLTDTLLMTFKKGGAKRTYLIRMESLRSGACFKVANSQEASFCRSNSELVEKYEEPRSFGEVNHHPNGEVESHGMITYYYNKPDDKMKKREGQWHFHDETGKLIEVAYYWRGRKLWRKRYE